MSEHDLVQLLSRPGVPFWRAALARWIESRRTQQLIVAVILVNAVLLGMETSPDLMERHGTWIVLADRICLGIFLVELLIKLSVYRLHFWRNGWNVFDFLVVSVALVPGAGPWSVLRTLRVLRVLRLLTVVPQLRKVVAAFLHSIPGLSGVVMVMAIFYYAMAVLATKLFGEQFPQWFGDLGASLFSLFQIMTLESWSMGIVRPIMETYPWAWAFFVPFIVVATFTILNLFIGIIVSTMQELATQPDPTIPDADLRKVIQSMEADLRHLRMHIERRTPVAPRTAGTGGRADPRGADR
ncbi:MAG: ion transporter [Puniceicoccaceae bacterium]